ncbi:MAG: hypothetical protein JWN86_3997 [Planctomycetota bacterium]|nr:hypothetical protein [Planctomycetota bacterium]
MQPETATRVECLLRRFGIGLGLLGAIAILLAMTGASAELQMLGGLAFGWWSYVARMAPRVTVSMTGMATAGVCLGLFTAGLHGFLRWLHRETRGGDSRWKPRWTLSIVGVIVVMFASGIATVGVAHQAGWLLSSTRMLVVNRPNLGGEYSGGDVKNNLKLIALAVHNYEGANGALPGDGLKEGWTTHSWLTVIMPFGHYGMASVDYGYAWNDARNTALFKSVIPDYLNPRINVLRDPDGYALSHISGNIHIFGRGRSLRFDEIGDLSQTMMAGEVASGFKPWGDPKNLRDPSRPFDGSPQAFGSPSGGGATVLMMDGSVKFVSDRADPKVLRALSGAIDRPGTRRSNQGSPGP